MVEAAVKSQLGLTASDLADAQDWLRQLQLEQHGELIFAALAER